MILNYTTQIAAEKTVAEIQSMLAKAKAQAVLTEYDTTGVLTAVSFRLNTVNGLASFRLPARVDNIHKVLQRGRLAARMKTREQAARVAWRILKDWLAAQLALVSAEMADVIEVFLPYMQGKNGVTLYEAMQVSRFEGWIALTDKST